MATIKIFLASSEELKPEREMMASLANSLNTVLEQQGVHVIVVEWENLDASMGAKHKQEDYNEKLRECEMCLVLYWTKFGMYTKTELDTAYKELKVGNNPKKLYVYFKKNSNPSDELKEFRDTFPTNYGHFYTPFENFDTLKAHFLLQFMEYQSQTLQNINVINVKDGKVVIAGKEYVDLMNVPFAGNNEEYNQTKEEIEDLKEDLEDLSVESPRYAKKAEKLLKLQEKLSKMENSLWDTALMITRLSTTKCSERLQRAMDLFTAGDNKGAQAVLNEEEIERDVEHSLHLIQLGEEGKKGLKINIEEYELKIKTLQNEMAEGWLENVIKLREKVLHFTQKIFGEKSEESLIMHHTLGRNLSTNAQYDEALKHFTFALETRKERLGDKHLDTARSYGSIGLTLSYLGKLQEALDYEIKALQIQKEIVGNKHSDTITSYNNIGMTYYRLGRYDEALDYTTKALEMCKEIRGEEHTATAIYYANVGKTYDRLHNFQEALKYKTKALEIQQKLRGDNYPPIAVTYDTIGQTYFVLGNYKKALEYITKALEIRKKIFGNKHPDTAKSYNHVACVYYELGEYQKALEYQNKAVKKSCRNKL